MQQISKSHMPNLMNTKATNQEVKIQLMNKNATNLGSKTTNQEIRKCWHKIIGKQTRLTNQLSCASGPARARVCFPLFMTKAQRQTQIQRPNKDKYKDKNEDNHNDKHEENNQPTCVSGGTRARVCLSFFFTKTKTNTTTKKGQ